MSVVALTHLSRSPLRAPWKQVAPWALLGVLTLVVLGPIAMVLLGGFNIASPPEPFRFGLQYWGEAFSDPGIGKALWNTVTIVVIRGVLGFAIAIPIAWLLARTNVPGASWLEFGFWVAFFMPSLAYIQGWSLLLDGQRGLVNQWLQHVPLLGAAAFDLYSYWGIIWVHLMSQNVSNLVVLLVLAFRNMDASLEEAAQVCGASRWRTIVHIALPLSRPIIAMLVVLAVVRGMQSYEVEAILGQPAGINVYSTLVVRMLATEPPMIQQGAALSTVVLLVLAPLIAMQRIYVGRTSYATISGKMRTALIHLGALGRWLAFSAIAVIVALQTIVPFVSVIAGSFMVRWGYFSIASPWTLDHWRNVLGNEQFLSCLTNTLTVAVAAGCAAAVACFLVAYVLVRVSFRGHEILEFVSWLPWAIPGVLLSLGFLTLVLDLVPLRPLYGSFFILVVAVVLFRFPLSVHLLKGGLMQISRELEEAARVCGSGNVSTQVRINVPLLMPMLISVALMTFVTAVSEISGVVLLASTDTRTLSLLSLDYLMGAQSQREAAAVVTTIMVVLCVGMALLGRAFGLRLGAGATSAPREARVA